MSHKRIIYLFFPIYFLLCIAMGLAICKFRGVINVECCIFKPFNLHMLISQHCYLFDFMLFQYFQVFNKDIKNTIDFGLKMHFEKLLAALGSSPQQKSSSAQEKELEHTYARAPNNQARAQMRSSAYQPRLKCITLGLEHTRPSRMQQKPNSTLDKDSNLPFGPGD